MTTLKWSVLIAVLVVGNAVMAFLVLTGGEESRDTLTVDAVVGSPRFLQLESAILRLEEAVQALEAEPGETGNGGRERSEATVGEASGSVAADVSARVDALEKKIADLGAAFEAFEVATILGEEEPDFGADGGYVHADKLAEGGKHSAAAEGYLKFLENHPDHPDFHDIAQKARVSLLRSGYVDQAIDVLKQLIEKFPERQERDYSILATMEKNAERYDDAIEHLEASIERTADKQTRLWRLMYRAWYVHLRDGDAAGLAAYREVDRIRESLGVNIEKMKKRLAEKINVLEERLRAPGG